MRTEGSTRPNSPLSLSDDGTELSYHHNEEGAGIHPSGVLDALAQVPVDIETLRTLSWETGGYGSDSLRRRVWPYLLSSSDRKDEDDECGANGRNLKAQVKGSDSYEPKVTEQVQRDVDRSISHYHHVKKWRLKRLKTTRKKVHTIVNSVVQESGGILNYYQGFHDVVCVILLVVGEQELAHALTERIAYYFFRESMTETFAPLSSILRLLPVIIEHFDPQLQQFISMCEVEAFYAMPWVLTWFAHDLQDLGEVARIFDVMICSHPLFVLYVAAALVLHNSSEVLSMERDFALVHSFLASAPKRNVPWDKVLLHAKRMLEDFPPREVLRCAAPPVRDAVMILAPTVCEYPPFWRLGLKIDDWITQLKSVNEKKRKAMRRDEIVRQMMRISPWLLLGVAATGLAYSGRPYTYLYT